MKAFIVVAALALSAPVLAQSDAKDEKASPPAAPAAEGNERSASGASSRRENESFTHGESARCAQLSGDEKQLCDKEEATKSQGQNAEELSRSAEPRQK